MYEYHGWLSTFREASKTLLESKLQEINGSYPISVESVNGNLHVAFSGNPNRDSGKLNCILEFLCNQGLEFYGCVYIHDPDSERFNAFSVIKIVNDTPYFMEDKNFEIEETKSIFE